MMFSKNYGLFLSFN